MHLPDHYLSPEVCAISAAAAAAGLAAGYLRFRRSDRPSTVALATTAAGVFAAQMVNFPVNSGTSGHLIGAALAAILLGPWPAMVVMTIVLAIQTLLFADGGLAALGANVLNMAVVAPAVGWGVYRLVNGAAIGIGRSMVSAAVAAWVSVVAAAVVCSIEIAASGTHSFLTALISMTSIHAVIGVGEALITAGVVGLALERSHVLRPKLPRWTGLAAAVGIVVLLAPLASSLPDGLESVAEKLHFAEGISATAPTAFMPDYSVSAIAGEELSTIAAGLFGLAACIAAALSFTRLTSPNQADSRS